MASKVYHMDGRSFSPQTSMVAKMLTVFEAAGFDNLIKRGDVVAIKVHCGEWDNTAYLRPVYARALADRIKALGGRPFVCDTTTLPYSPNSSVGSSIAAPTRPSIKLDSVSRIDQSGPCHLLHPAAGERYQLTKEKQPKVTRLKGAKNLFH